MNAETLSITLPADMAEFIRNQVTAGTHASSSEVVREALQLWQSRNAARDDRLEAIRAQIQEAVEDPRRVTDEELGRNFDKRLAQAEPQRGP